MAESAGAGAGAENPTVAVAENDEDRARRVRRLRSAVERAQTVVDELADAPQRAEQKYANYNKWQAAEVKEAKKMQAEAARALKDAEAALKAEDG